MKRIKTACLEQTIHFFIQDASTVRTAEHEFEAYVERMKRNNTAYKVISKEKQADGSLIVKLKKQYNTYPCGEYMD